MGLSPLQAVHRMGLASVAAVFLVFAVSLPAAAVVDPVNPRPVDGYVGLQPSHLALSPDDSTIYVANFGSSTISVIDAATSEQTSYVQGYTGVQPFDVAFSPDGSLAYVTGRDVNVIDTATNTQIAVVPGLSSFQSRVAFSPDGTRAYVMSAQAAGELAIIDTATHTVVGTVTGFAGFLYGDLAVTPDGATLLMANYGASQVDIVDLAAETLTGSVTGFTGSSPSSIALSADKTTAWVTSEDTDTVSVIDLDSLSEADAITVGSRPAEIERSPSGDYMYVTNIRGGDVSVISTSDRAVVATLPNYVGNRPIGIAVTGTGDAAYVAERTGNQVVRVPIPSLAPGVADITPARGPITGGSTVVVEGVNLETATGVLFNGVPGQNVTVSADGRSITVTTPPQTRGSAAVTVQLPGGDIPAGSFDFFTTPDPPQTAAASSSGQQVSLVWAAPLSDGGDPVAGYRILQRVVGTGTWAVANAVISGTTATVSDLADGTEYEFGIVAYNLAGDGTPAIVRVLVPDDGTTPGDTGGGASPPSEASPPGQLAESGAGGTALLALLGFLACVGGLFLAGRRMST